MYGKSPTTIGAIADRQDVEPATLMEQSRVLYTNLLEFVLSAPKLVRIPSNFITEIASPIIV